MIAAYLGGLILGLGLITPIGAQNVFVVSQGFAVGIPRALWAVIAAAYCDTILIVLGAAGMSGLIIAVPAARTGLLLAGTFFLGYLAWQAFRSGGHGFAGGAPTGLSAPRVLARTVSVSLLNPHAIFDTVGVIGAAVLAQPAHSRLIFAAGAISASWIWFALLAVGAAKLRGTLGERSAVWFDRISGSIMLAFAVRFFVEFVKAAAS